MIDFRKSQKRVWLIEIHEKFQHEQYPLLNKNIMNFTFTGRCYISINRKDELTLFQGKDTHGSEDNQDSI